MRKTRTEKMLGAALLAVAVAMVLVILAGIGVSVWMLHKAYGPEVERREATPVAVQTPYPKRHYATGYTGIAPVVVTRRF